MELTVVILAVLYFYLIIDLRNEKRKSKHLHKIAHNLVDNLQKANDEIKLLEDAICDDNTLILAEVKVKVSFKRDCSRSLWFGRYNNSSKATGIFAYINKPVSDADIKPDSDV